MKSIVMVLGVLLFSCSPRTPLTHTSSSESNLYINGKLYGSFFQQHAAEYKALCFQAFNIARMRIDQYKPQTTLPLCIITDLDETILDNSPYQTHRNLKGVDYDPISWANWTQQAAADTVPGAGSFLRYAASKNVEVFYISNRTVKETTGTLENLRKLRLPNADSAHLLLKSTTSGKETRRLSVRQHHEVMLLLGDNLADFTGLFDKKSQSDREAVVTSLEATFGDRFIVLPNMVYGDWEHALFQYKYDLPASTKDSLIRASLRTY